MSASSAPRSAPAHLLGWVLGVVLFLIVGGCASDAGAGDQTAGQDAQASEPSDDETSTQAPSTDDDATADDTAQADDDAGAGDGADDATDYADDAGAELETYEYPDDPDPAEGVVATLCNLNYEYFTSLRSESVGGELLIDDHLRLSVLTISDNLFLWDGLRAHYPDLEADIDTAWDVRNSWDEALLNQENGHEARAAQAMQDAEEDIANLPSIDSLGDIECVA